MKDYFDLKNVLCDLQNGPVLSPPPTIFTHFVINIFQKSESSSKLKLRTKKSQSSSK